MRGNDGEEFVVPVITLPNTRRRTACTARDKVLGKHETDSSVRGCDSGLGERGRALTLHCITAAYNGPEGKQDIYC